MPVMQLSYYGPRGVVYTYETENPSIMVGSQPDCDIIVDRLRPQHCRIDATTEGYYAHDLGGDIAINGRPGEGSLKDDDVLQIGHVISIRFNVEDVQGRSGLSSESVEVVPVEPEVHRAGFALFASLIVPGAGQAYNGRPFKAAFLFLVSILVLPWIYSVFDAYREAGSMIALGGRVGRGGLIWVVLHLWFCLVIVLLALVVLSYRGVLL